ncbi:longitudinals lacking protein, isoforms H/M/V-like isoform X12 [Penaeus chinensis]|uniref:longitudinals lacking protein, isoforms H/M/V-like isoform X12 n=1 Tax=Penaeus chinensis TaxID=139456 RepID=UPI001FB7E4D7|nr:longitudinals lacking protein, isoforms H/M/V-like isoform X12 [Penaeus chinensis]XP_047492366.1 longitudinals lacking protein, isoforms H/M/V-like isoform X12 [Penaeus chinensis]
MTDGMLSLSWNNHKATFCHILSTLREKERYTDVTVACEGKFYPVHKLVLSTCSEYFEKMFDNTPCKHPVIVLKDVLPDELEALLSYMYDGVVSVAQNDLARLIKAAELLRIKGLAVPDEPPKSEGNRRKSTQSRNASDDRSSPHPKRRKGDESSTASQRNAPAPASPPSSPRVSPFQGDNEQQQQGSSRIQQDSHWMDQRDDPKTDHIQEDRLDNHASSQSPSPKVQVLVDETLVKEEMEEPLSTNQDDGMDYGSLGSDSRLEGSCGGEGDDNASLMIPNKYEQNVATSQAQPLPEAVVEALAGPSGMQGWLGGCDVPSGFSGMEGYSGDGSQEVHQPPQGPAGAQAQQAHQMIMLNCDDEQRTGRGGDTALRCKTHHCPYCSYSTTKTTNLKNHIRVHTGERPFTCPHCSYRAKQENNLKSHIRRHTGEKPYACSYCPYRSIKISTLRRHMQTHRYGSSPS